MPEKGGPAVKPVAVAKEELYFANQLRGYSGVLASFEALDRDICHNSCSLPAAVIIAQKRLLVIVRLVWVVLRWVR